MRTIDPGHKYELAVYDGEGNATLQFMKRIGDNYPGNEAPAVSGTNCQDVLRALIDRMIYVNGQKPHICNQEALNGMREALWQLECRAADLREGLASWIERLEVYSGVEIQPSVSRPSAFERFPTCEICGHVLCGKH